MRATGNSGDHSATRQFATSEHGGVAVLFALMVLVIIGVGGVAIDASRGFSVQGTLQQDIDRTALYVGKRIASGDTTVDPRAEAQSFLDALTRQKHVIARPRIVDVSSANGIVRASAAASVPVTLMRLFGFNTVEVTVAAEVAIGEQPVEVALVLDNTRSMEGTRMTVLRSAAKDLIDSSFNAPNAASFVKLGIVPFSDYVNVGVANRGASWLAMGNDFTTSDLRCSFEPNTTLVANSCEADPATYTQDGQTFTSTHPRCSFQFPSYVGKCGGTTEFKWDGCVGSRATPLDLRDDTYTTKVPGLYNTWCAAALTPLQSNAATLKSKIDELYVTGNTYLPAGLMWGWRVLSPDQPFNQGSSYAGDVDGKRVRKILVLMTDGENSVSADTPHHWGDDVAAANQKTRDACVAIKRTGIEIFTVAFEVTDAEVKGILSECASSPSNYFDAQNGEALKSSFQAIAEAFSPLRLTR